MSFFFQTSLKRKILLPLLAVLTAVLGWISLWQVNTFRTELINRLKERSEDIASIIELTGNSPLKAADLQDLIADLAAGPEVKTVMVLGGEPARVVASTRTDFIGRLPHELDDPEIRDELEHATKISAIGYHLDDAGNDFDYYRPVTLAKSGPLQGNRPHRGLVLVSLDTRPLHAEVARTTLQTITGYVAAILLIAVSGWFLLHAHIFKPLVGIGKTIDAFDGRKSHLPMNATQYSGELARLAGAWNGLVERLSRESAERSGAEEALSMARDGLEERIAERTSDLEKANEALQTSVQQLEQSRHKLQMVIEAIPVRVFWKDQNLVYRGGNTLFARDAGLENPQQLVGEQDHALAWKDQADAYRADDRQVLEAGIPRLNLLEPQTTPQGTTAWLSTSKVPLRATDGRVYGVLGIYEDVTERIRAEESLRLLSAAVEQSKESILISDAQLDLPGPGIIFVNQAFTQMTGYTAAEVMGKTPRILQGPGTDRAVLQRLRENLTRGEVCVGETVNYRKDGTEFYIEWQIAPLRNAAGTVTHHVAIQRDVTERNAARKALEQAHRDLRHASRLAGMAEIATNVLHNVGNVLNSVNISCAVISEKIRNSRISGVGKTAELLSRHQGDLAAYFTAEPTGQLLPEYLSRLAAQLVEEKAVISKEVELLSENINHIKEIVAMQQNHARFSGVSEITDLAVLIENGLSMSAEALNRHEVEVVRDFGEVAPVGVEKHKVLQILVNLISNAKSACIESGRPDKRITLRLTAADGNARITVIDNGVGISPANLTRIFAHGFTTKPDGHGFGLHSSVLAAREMGGDLTVASEGSGNGATFTLILPILQPP